MKRNRIISVLLVLALIVSLSSAMAFAQDEPLTRGEAAAMLLSAADDYNAGVQKGDVIKGYGDGQLYEEQPATYTEALVMLQRAFGGLPAPTGHNALTALPAPSAATAPAWSQTVLENVFTAGIVDGGADNSFNAGRTLTAAELDTLIRRSYSLFGTNAKDDFYATVNKEALNTMKLLPGRTITGSLYALTDKTTEEVNAILQEIAVGSFAKGTNEQKIAALYRSVCDREGRDAAGIDPIKPYLAKVDAAGSIEDLVALQELLFDELCVEPFCGFGLTTDLKDSTRYMLAFGTLSPNMTKDLYTAGEEYQKAAYLKYLSTLLVLGGAEQAAAEQQAAELYELEARLAAASLDPMDYSNVDKVYNPYTLSELQGLLPNVDLSRALAHVGLKEEPKINVTDPGLLKTFAAEFTDANLSALKTAGKLAILVGYGATLNHDFTDASSQFQQDYLGVSGSYTDEENAVMQVQELLPEYIGQIYARRYFSEEAKQDVEQMVQDILAVYNKRIEALNWMSEATKEKAQRKLNTMAVKVGYPDDWSTYLDNVDIKSPDEGGSYFLTVVDIAKAQTDYVISLQGTTVDRTEWVMYPFTVNACYSATANDITFPAAFLQAPLYDINASYEENLGGIGYVIAHEITHAFDNNGAKFDENGNAADWWTPEDYAAFRALCEKMAAFYDGWESIPGVPINGTLTLSENVADNGACQCVTQIVREQGGDFQALYRSLAITWANTCYREYAIYHAQTNVHSPGNLRVNRVVVNCDEFFEAFDVKKGDGMYVAPEDRVVIW